MRSNLLNRYFLATLFDGVKYYSVVFESKNGSHPSAADIKERCEKDNDYAFAVKLIILNIHEFANELDFKDYIA